MTEEKQDLLDSIDFILRDIEIFASDFEDYMGCEPNVDEIENLLNNIKKQVEEK